MTIANIKKNDCTGCCACMNLCPRNAIQMVADEEGFYIPQITMDMCVDCGICYSSCPGKNENTADEASVGYLARLRDHHTLKSSASGGAFVGIAHYMLKKYDALVVGAAIMEDLSVRHIVVESTEQLIKLQNSKYVQSFVGDIYGKVYKALKDGRRVLFSGTPCQVAGLYAAVPPKYREHLYTVDIVCHGVPSPALLKRQLQMDSNSKQGSVVDYRFRYKNPNADSYSSFMMMMVMSKGIPLVRRISQDVYFNLFIQGMTFRESCYTCKYANLKRIGDFTIGDCDSREFYPEFYPKESNSILLPNTDKAKHVWNDLSGSFEFTELDVIREAQYNHQLDHPFQRPEQRNGIYKALLNHEWSAIKATYAIPQSKLDRYKLLLLLNTPEWVKNVLAKMTRRSAK